MVLHPTPSAVSSRILLSCHAAHPCQAVSACEVSVAWKHHGLELTYRLDGFPGKLLVPSPARHPGFADGLWQHTCLEAFIALPDGERYREFNFSPSGNWAAYTFQTYRQRDTAWQPSVSPSLEWHSDTGLGVLRAGIPRELLPAGSTLQLGLCAITEDLDGGISYWALRHAGAKPDFHRREDFCLTLTNLPDSAS